MKRKPDWLLFIGMAISIVMLCIPIVIHNMR